MQGQFTLLWIFYLSVCIFFWPQNVTSYAVIFFLNYINDIFLLYDLDPVECYHVHDITKQFIYMTSPYFLWDVQYFDDDDHVWRTSN